MTVMKHDIVLNNIEDIKLFAVSVMGICGEITISRGSHRSNAKSIMGLLAIDPSVPCTLEIRTEDATDMPIYNKIVDAFGVK